MEGINKNNRKITLSDRGQYFLNILELDSHSIEEKTLAAFDSTTEMNELKEIMFKINHVIKSSKIIFDEIGMESLNNIVKKVVHSSYLISMHLLKNQVLQNEKGSETKRKLSNSPTEKQFVTERRQKQKTGNMPIQSDNLSKEILELQINKIENTSIVNRQLGGVALFNESRSRKLEKILEQQQAKRKAKKTDIFEEETKNMNLKQFKRYLLLKMKRQIKMAQETIYTPVEDQVSSFIIFERKYLESFNHFSRADHIEDVIDFFNQSTLQAMNFLKKNNMTEEISKFQIQIRDLLKQLQYGKEYRQKNIQVRFQNLLKEFEDKRQQFNKKIIDKITVLQQEKKLRQGQKVTNSTQTGGNQLKDIKIYQKRIADLQNRLTYFQIQKQKKFQQLLQKIDSKTIELRNKQLEIQRKMLQKEEQINILKLQIEKAEHKHKEQIGVMNEKIRKKQATTNNLTSRGKQNKQNSQTNVDKLPKLKLLKQSSIKLKVHDVENKRKKSQISDKNAALSSLIQESQRDHQENKNYDDKQNNQKKNFGGQTISEDANVKQMEYFINIKERNSLTLSESQDVIELKDSRTSRKKIKSFKGKFSSKLIQQNNNTNTKENNSKGLVSLKNIIDQYSKNKIQGEGQNIISKQQLTGNQLKIDINDKNNKESENERKIRKFSFQERHQKKYYNLNKISQEESQKSQDRSNIDKINIGGNVKQNKIDTHSKTIKIADHNKSYEHPRKSKQQQSKYLQNIVLSNRGIVSKDKIGYIKQKNNSKQKRQNNNVSQEQKTNKKFKIISHQCQISIFPASLSKKYEYPQIRKPNAKKHNPTQPKYQRSSSYQDNNFLFLRGSKEEPIGEKNKQKFQIIEFKKNEQEDREIGGKKQEQFGKLQGKRYNSLDSSSKKNKDLLHQLQKSKFERGKIDKFKLIGASPNKNKPKQNQPLNMLPFIANVKGYMKEEEKNKNQRAKSLEEGKHKENSIRKDKQLFNIFENFHPQTQQYKEYEETKHLRYSKPSNVQLKQNFSSHQTAVKLLRKKYTRMSFKKYAQLQQEQQTLPLIHSLQVKNQN